MRAACPVQSTPSMKLLPPALLLSCTLLAAACHHGPNAADVARARTASYACTADQNWGTLVASVRDRYPDAAASESRREVITMPRFYHADGAPWRGGIARTKGPFRTASSADDPRLAHRYQVQLAFTLEQDGERWRVSPRPIVVEIAPPLKPARLEPTSKDVPAWVSDHIDAVLVEYRERNASCAVVAERPSAPTR